MVHNRVIQILRYLTFGIGTYIRYQFFGLVVMMQVTLDPDPRAPYNRIAFYVVLLFINQLLIFLQNWSQVISNYPFIKVPTSRINFLFSSAEHFTLDPAKPSSKHPQLANALHRGTQLQIFS